MHTLIENYQNEIQMICEENHVKSLYFFGSILHPERFNENSDIDILVSFREGISMEIYTDSYFNIQFAMEELLGHHIDITTERSVQNPYFKDELDKTKVLFFDALAEIDG